MELIFSLTREDYQQFCSLAYARVAAPSKASLGLKGALFPLASVGLTLLVLDYLYRTHVIDDRAFVAAGLGYVWAVLSWLLLVWFLVPLWQRRIWTNWLPDDSVVLREVRLKLDSDGIETSDPTTVTKYSWRAFSDISERDDLIVLWLDRVHGILVPARALADQEARRHFVSLAREYVAPWMTPRT